MNKITKKLFRYFFSVSFIFAIIVFVGFCNILKYYMIEHHIEEIEERVVAIKEQLEWMNKEGREEGKGAYIKYLNDVTLADVYVVTKDNSSFTCGKNPNSEKKPTKEISQFAQMVFDSKQYEQVKIKESDIVYAGIPIEEKGEITSAVVLVDYVHIDQKSFFLSITVLLVCLLFALFLSGILAFFLAKRFISPIHKIAFAIRQLANGNYEVKTEVDDDTEIGTLAKETDILAQKLDYASKESERMNQMQKDYIANISHELRTPVTVLRSFIEALCDDIIPEDEIEEYEQQMLSETISLQRLVNDMLELSRLENEDFPIEMETINLLFVLEDAIRSIRMIAIEKNICIHYEGLEQEWMIEGDYGRLRQMFVAVLDNAIKYSNENKNIWIKAIKKSGYYYISIQDEGDGMKEEEQPFVFDKFYRSKYKKTSGTGLGMAIVKKIADRHKIEIHLHSVYRKETRITFIIPINNKIR